MEKSPQPQVNPAEQITEQLKDITVNQVPESINAAQAVTEQLAIDAEQVVSRNGHAYIHGRRLDDRVAAGIKIVVAKGVDFWALSPASRVAWQQASEAANPHDLAPDMLARLRYSKPDPLLSDGLALDSFRQHAAARLHLDGEIQAKRASQAATAEWRKDIDVDRSDRAATADRITALNYQLKLANGGQIALDRQPGLAERLQAQAVAQSTREGYKTTHLQPDYQPVTTPSQERIQNQAELVALLKEHDKAALTSHQTVESITASGQATAQEQDTAVDNSQVLEAAILAARQRVEAAQEDAADLFAAEPTVVPTTAVVPPAAPASPRPTATEKIPAERELLDSNDKLKLVTNRKKMRDAQHKLYELKYGRHDPVTKLVMRTANQIKLSRGRRRDSRLTKRVGEAESDYLESRLIDHTVIPRKESNLDHAIAQIHDKAGLQDKLRGDKSYRIPIMTEAESRQTGKDRFVVVSAIELNKRLMRAIAAERKKSTTE